MESTTLERMTLPLSKGKVAVIDAADFEQELRCEFKDGTLWTGRICDHKWAAQESAKTFYAFITITPADGKQRQLYLHRAITCATRFQLIDHKDNCGLHCWRDNLRVATFRNNAQNRRPRADRKYKGVYFHKMTGKYTAAIGINGKSHHLGLFSSQDEAARAYDAAAIRIFGDFARLNFPQGGA